jgi:hypothetical protein
MLHTPFLSRASELADDADKPSGRSAVHYSFSHGAAYDPWCCPVLLELNILERNRIMKSVMSPVFNIYEFAMNVSCHQIKLPSPSNQLVSLFEIFRFNDQVSLNHRWT